MRRTRLNALDQHFLPWDRLEPLCILCEVRVQGRMNPERLVAAVRAAALRHPMARARLAMARWPGVAQYWEIADHLQDVPLEILECPEDAMVDEARSRLLSRRVDLRTAPPFALMLAHRSGGDSLSMSLSHVVGDGMSAQRLMRSIAYAYAGIADPIAGPDPLSVRDLSFYRSRSPSAEWIRQVHKISKRRRNRPQAPTTAFVTRGGERPAFGSGFRGFQLLHLGRDETAAVVAQRQASETVSDVLIASLALAMSRWNEAHGVKRRRVNVQTPVNLRPKEWFTEVVSNLATDVNIAVDATVQDSRASAQRAVAKQTYAIKQRREAADIDVATLLNVVPRPLRYSVARWLQRRPNRSTTAALSNLGAVDVFPDFSHGAGPVTELWFSPPGTAALGTLAGTLTLGGEMFIALHYRRMELDGTSAQAFAETWREILLDPA